MADSGNNYVRDNNFTKVLRSLATDCSQFKTEACKEVFEWWQSYQPDMPQKNQFDILDHIEKAPNIFLIAVLGNGQFRYCLHGEEVVRLVGKSQAGTLFSVDNADNDLSRFARFLEELCSKKSAMHSYGTLDAHGKSYLNFESLDFPLVDEQGVITHTVGLITLVD
ncbi:hypothetical protein [Kiloniella sp.]|uniref:hypothetical protein n=1 Tax=Kiloniella sp. TaxID=1938587 RepID=UPI003B011D30